MLGQLVAGFGEHALVLRRTRSFAALLRMSALEAVGLDSEVGFLMLGVGRLSGQICRRSACGIPVGTAADHLES